VRVDTAAPRTTTLPTVAAQYETLRSAALGAPLPPEARHGLLLFLGRGMWAWTQAVATATAILPPPTRAPAAAAPSPHERCGIIHVFAAMAQASPPRRAR
jgi:hypothetical protein